jgi:hypothetical protein
MARDSTENCTVTIEVVDINCDPADPNAMCTKMSVPVMVGRGSCIADECPVGEIRNLNLDNCNCESLYPTETNLIDA